MVAYFFQVAPGQLMRPDYARIALSIVGPLGNSSTWTHRHACPRTHLYTHMHTCAHALPPPCPQPPTG